MNDQLANLGGSGEGDFVHQRMRSERCAGSFSVARDNVHDAFREARFQNQFAEAQDGKRCLLGGLQYHRAARSQCRPQFPGGHEQREVPRDDLPDHADRLAQRVSKILRTRCIRHRDRNGRAFDLGRPARHVAK